MRVLSLTPALFCALCAASVSAQKTPQPVNIDYPFLTRVSEYLATKYEQDNLDKAAQKADQMILLDALAERTTANVVKEREAKLPFAGGIEVPVQTQVAEAGNLYFISGIIEQQSKSYAIRKLDPWPMWQLVLGKLFRADEGKVYVIRYITAKRETVALSSQAAQAAIKFAMEGLNSRMNVHRLASVIAVEKQSLQASDFEQLTVTALKPAPSLEVYYIYFLTSDKRQPRAPATEHAVAVLRTPTQLKIVRHTYFGEPGFTILKGTFDITTVGVGDFTSSKQNSFKKALAQSLGASVVADDIQILNLNTYRPAAAAAAGGGAAAVRRLGLATRAKTAAMAIGADGQFEAAAEMPSMDGTQIQYSISLAGSGATVEKRMASSSFSSVLVSNLQSAGMTGIAKDSITMQERVVLRNSQHPQSNKAIGFVVLTMGAFVMGVLLTAGIGVWGMRRNRAVAQSAGGGNAGQYQQVDAAAGGGGYQQ